MISATTGSLNEEIEADDFAVRVRNGHQTTSTEPSEQRFSHERGHHRCDRSVHSVATRS
jgi:hypothetical protein